MFLKAVLSLCVIFLSLVPLSAQENYDPYKTYTVEELRKDYDEVIKALLAAHPGLYTFQSFNEFRYKATLSRGLIEDNMTERDFYKIISHLVNEVKCGHTFILPSLGAIEHYKDKAINFPFVLNVSSEGATIKKVFREEDEAFLGEEIKTINGFSWSTIKDSLWHYIPADGYIQTRKNFLLSQNFEFFYRVFFGTPPTFNIELKDTTAIVEPVSYEQIAEHKKTVPRLENKIVNDTAYLKLNTFSESKPFKKEVNKAFKKIRKEEVNNLVIDLRENDGGSTENMIYVLAYLMNDPFTIFDTIKVSSKTTLESFFKQKKQQKHYVEQIKYDSTARQYYWDDKHNLATHQPRKKRFNGQITVLAGGGTFSSAVHFIACLLNDQKITIIGEETGGFADHNNGGVIPKVVLPSTGLRLSVPLFQGRYYVDFDYQRGRGIMPDKEATSISKN